MYVMFLKADGAIDVSTYEVFKKCHEPNGAEYIEESDNWDYIYELSKKVRII